MSVQEDKPVVAFDHHSEEFARHAPEIYAELRGRCPVAWTEAYNGYWVVSRYADVFEVARDDATFSSAHPEGTGEYGGIQIPNWPIMNGIIETDPPRLRPLRKAVEPWFSPAAVDKMRPELLGYTTQAIDKFIERGEADLVEELAAPIPALLTVRLLGLPLEEAPRYADIFHRAIYVPPDSPERQQVLEDMFWAFGQFHEAAVDRQAHPRDDLISFFAHLEIDGEKLPLEEVVGNIVLMMSGGLDTTTALLSNTFVHLDREPEARAWLMADRSRMRYACEEYLRFYTPVQGLARTVTSQCTLGNQRLEPDDRLMMFWASANRDPEQFDDPDTIKLDRWPNRHAAFGLGAHRCLGSNVARAIWDVVMNEVFSRLPDFAVDHDRCARYTSIGTVNGWINVPVTFTPGRAIN